jgi:hypothetical protein
MQVVKLNRELRAIRLPAINGDRILDLIAVADYLSWKPSYVRWFCSTHSSEFPIPLTPDEMGNLLSKHPQLQAAFAEMVNRCGGSGKPGLFWTFSSVASFKANRGK